MFQNQTEVHFIFKDKMGNPNISNKSSLNISIKNKRESASTTTNMFLNESLNFSNLHFSHLSNGNMIKFHAHRVEGIKWGSNCQNRVTLYRGCSESIQLREGMRINDRVLLLITKQIIDPSGAQMPLEKRGLCWITCDFSINSNTF